MRVALVGAGNFSRVHARAIAGTPDLELVAVADPVTQLAAGIADPVGATVHGDPLGVLEQHPDLVVVASPTWLHAEHAGQFLDAGYDVLVEKPIAVSSGDGIALQQLAQDKGRWLGVVFQRRYQLGVSRLGEMVRAGELGEVTSAALSNVVWRSPEYWSAPPWRGDPRLGGGDVMNHGMHALDLVVWLLGRPTRTASILREHDGLELATVAGMEHPGGVLSTFLCSTVGPDLPLELVVHGSLGTARFQEDTLTLQQRDGDIETLVRGDSAYDALARMYADVAELRAQGLPVPGCDAGAAIDTLLTAESLLHG